MQTNCLKKLQKLLLIQIFIYYYILQIKKLIFFCALGQNLKQLEL